VYGFLTDQGEFCKEREIGKERQENKRKVRINTAKTLRNKIIIKIKTNTKTMNN
jgi:hypothetical protein